jgi:hypothetical protein
MKVPHLASAAILVMVICFPPAAVAGVQEGDRTALFLVDVQLDKAVKLSHLKPGDRLQGRVKRDVYSGDRRLIPSGSPVDLTVSKTERRRREPSDRWPWLVRLLAPRHVNYPSSLAAVVSLPDGSKLPMPASLASASHEVKLTAQARKATKLHGIREIPRANPLHRKGSQSDATPTLLLVVERPLKDGSPSRDSGASPATTPENLAAGTVAHVVLLDGLRTSKSHTGDAFLARLTEPVRVGSRVVLPEGVLLQGRVIRSVPPRWLSRPGSLSLAFTQLRLPAGGTAAIVASPSGALVDRASGLRMDSEGVLIGGGPGKTRFLIDLGVAGGISKAADDSFQLVAEALISTATDASTAGSAKIVAAVLSGLYLVTRHGRDVFLPPYTRMEISFDRPALLPSCTSP